MNQQQHTHLVLDRCILPETEGRKVKKVIGKQVEVEAPCIFHTYRTGAEGEFPIQAAKLYHAYNWLYLQDGTDHH